MAKGVENEESLVPSPIIKLPVIHMVYIIIYIDV